MEGISPVRQTIVFEPAEANGRGDLARRVFFGQHKLVVKDVAGAACACVDINARRTIPQIQRVKARAAIGAIITCAGGDRVITLGAIDAVIATPARQGVIPVAAINHVIAVRAVKRAAKTFAICKGGIHRVVPQSANDFFDRDQTKAADDKASGRCETTESCLLGCHQAHVDKPVETPHALGRFGVNRPITGRGRVLHKARKVQHVRSVATVDGADAGAGMDQIVAVAAIDCIPAAQAGVLMGD